MKKTFTNGIQISWFKLTTMIFSITIGLYIVVSTQNFLYISAYLLIINLFLYERIVEIDFKNKKIRSGWRILLFNIGKWKPLSEYDVVCLEKSNDLPKLNVLDDETVTHSKPRFTLSLKGNNGNKKIEILVDFREKLIQTARYLEENTSLPLKIESQPA